MEKMGLYVFDILPPRIWHRRRSIVCRGHAVMDARNGWESFLTTDKRGSKLDMLNYSTTYTPRVSFVEETPFASDKSPLKLVATTGQREALPTGRLSQALEHVKCCKNNAYDQFEQLTPPKYMAQPYDQNGTADRS